MKFLDRIFSIENKYIGGQNVIVIKLLWIEIIFEVNKHCKVKIKFNSTIEKLKRENRILISENNCSAPLLVNVKLGEYFCYLFEC